MALTRHHYKINGIVQGVGFRPFVYRLANDRALSGWVRNSPAGVEIEIQGSAELLASFECAISSEAPPLADINTIIKEEISVSATQGFSILPSTDGEPDIQIAPDSALCSDCLREMFDPTDRRFRYPFITCTNCGPRYSIITAIPYDRPNTTMAGFPLCPDCQDEYQNPLDRRFHAQPIACHTCGPQMSLITAQGDIMAARDEAVVQAVQHLKNGAIIAVKGIGGYHLAVDACNHAAVERLRVRKKRDEKPFAVMAADIETARTLVQMDEREERLLCSPEAPIIIVKKRHGTLLSPLIAPHNGWLGLMLPYAPLHHLLMQNNFTALVMTSGNISDEPVAFEDNEALQRLSGIADYFLLHDRPIHIRSDDSVVRVFQGKPLFYRRARGYAPRAVTLPFAVPPLLAVGAELKSAVCCADGTRAVLSQHIGDLQNSATFDSFSHIASHLSGLLAIKPARIACDLHPDYLSSRYAEDSGLPLIRVQHHHAHMASCMAENGLDGEAIGIIFDGTGYGTDGTIWGGEFLVGGYDGYRRAGHFRPVPLPGGDAAVREPWRMALSYLYQAVGDAAFTIDHPVARILPEGERLLFAQMLRRGINSPLTTSCGRLFDAVAALLNLRHTVSYDGQGAIELEALAEADSDFKSKSPPAPLSQRGGYNHLSQAGGYNHLSQAGGYNHLSQAGGGNYPSQGGEYSFTIVHHENMPLQVDFTPMFTDILADITHGIPSATIAHRFHQTVASAATEVCLRIAAATGLNRVIFSGGVFQNRLLTEMIYTALSQKGLHVFTHRLIPPNDGGIAVGQAAIAARRGI